MSFHIALNNGRHVFSIVYLGEGSMLKGLRVSRIIFSNKSHLLHYIFYILGRFQGLALMTSKNQCRSNLFRLFYRLRSIHKVR